MFWSTTKYRDFPLCLGLKNKDSRPKHIGKSFFFFLDQALRKIPLFYKNWDVPLWLVYKKIKGFSFMFRSRILIFLDLNIKENPFIFL